MPSGWVRWMFENFGFDFEVVYPPALDAGNLKEKFDVLVFVGGAIPAEDPDEPEEFPDPGTIPEEYRDRLGSVTVEKTVPQLRQFLESGGAILTIGSSTNLAYHLELPVADALVERGKDGEENSLPREKYFVPGSILKIHLDNTHPLAFGLPEELDVMFNKSPLFALEPQSAIEKVIPVGWFDTDTPLKSGWAWGQHYLERGVTIIEAEVGQGKLFLFTPEIANRAQTHGTFKLLFNGIYYGGATTTKF